MPPFAIEPALSAADIAAVAGLFRAYQVSLAVDLCFQGFEAELAGLPGDYAPPRGALLLARNAEGEPVGCVALRPLDAGGIGEMKRLYVAPEGRGGGLGRALLRAIVSCASEAGYAEIRLDTLPDMSAAQALYRSEGFEAAAPYYETPIGGTVFMRRRLRD